MIIIYNFPEIGAAWCSHILLYTFLSGWNVFIGPISSNHVSLPRCSNAFQPSGPRRCQFTTSQCAAAFCVGSQRTRDWLAKFGTAPSRDKRPTLSIPSILTVSDRSVSVPHSSVVDQWIQWIQWLTNRFQQQTLHISLHKLVNGFGLPRLPFASFSLSGLIFCGLFTIVHNHSSLHHFPQAKPS